MQEDGTRRGRGAGRTAGKSVTTSQPPRSRVFHDVTQAADAGYVDVDGVAGGQGEVIRRHDAGAGEQHGYVGEAVVAAEPAHEVLEGALHSPQCGRALEY